MLIQAGVPFPEHLTDHCRRAHGQGAHFMVVKAWTALAGVFPAAGTLTCNRGRWQTAISEKQRRFEVQESHG